MILNLLPGDEELEKLIYDRSKIVDKKLPMNLANAEIPDNLNLSDNNRGIIIYGKAVETTPEQVSEYIKKLFGMDKKVDKIRLNSNQIIKSIGKKQKYTEHSIKKAYAQYKNVFNEMKKQIKDKEKEADSMIKANSFTDEWQKRIVSNVRKTAPHITSYLSVAIAISNELQRTHLSALQKYMAYARILAKKCVDMAISEGYPIK